MEDIKFGKTLLENRESLKKLSSQQFYKTSTQRYVESLIQINLLFLLRRAINSLLNFILILFSFRFYDGANWDNVLPKEKRVPVLPQPRNDKSELEGQLKRYNKSREDYQVSIK